MISILVQIVASYVPGATMKDYARNSFRRLHAGCRIRRDVCVSGELSHKCLLSGGKQRLGDSAKIVTNSRLLRMTPVMSISVTILIVWSRTSSTQSAVSSYRTCKIVIQKV
jgi:hypothetical protein